MSHKAMLEGIRILEIEGLGPAPYAGMLLADLGAEVIVVHRPELPLMAAPENSILDRGKKSIVLDLKNPDSQTIARKLAMRADGLIEGFRPGVMERLGLGPDALCTDNPALVYGRLTGWGQDGPRARQAGHELNYIATSGALWFSSLPDDAPASPTTMLGDIGGGAMFLVAGMLASLLRARETGQGTVVDAAIVDGSAHMMNLLLTAQSAGAIQEARGTSILDGAPWCRCYQTKCGNWLSVHCLEPKFYECFLEILGKQDDPGYEQSLDMRGWPLLTEQLATLIADEDLDHWSARFAGSDACVAPVLSPSASAQDAHMRARGVWLDAGSVRQARAAPRFGGMQPEDPAPPPTRGQHTEELLAQLNAE